MTPAQFLSDAQQQDRRDYTLLHKPGVHAPKPCGSGVLLVDVYIDAFMGWLRAGQRVDVYPEGRIGSAVGHWSRTTFCYYGLVVPVLELVEMEPVYVPETEMVR